MILLCCWRTAKESSLLLGDIAGIVTTLNTEFSNELIRKICSNLTLLLSETKHRGAFEQIYVAYLKVCSTMWKYVQTNLLLLFIVHCFMVYKMIHNKILLLWFIFMRNYSLIY